MAKKGKEAKGSKNTRAKPPAAAPVAATVPPPVNKKQARTTKPPAAAPVAATVPPPVAEETEHDAQQRHDAIHNEHGTVQYSDGSDVAAWRLLPSKLWMTM